MGDGPGRGVKAFRLDAAVAQGLDQEANRTARVEHGPGMEASDYLLRETAEEPLPDGLPPTIWRWSSPGTVRGEG
jgi:hypothetical protein